VPDASEGPPNGRARSQNQAVSPILRVRGGTRSRTAPKNGSLGVLFHAFTRSG
jgi:hypothetical protein